MKIAVILPLGKPDYLANTVLDGLIDLGVEFKATDNYPAPFTLENRTLSEEDFITYSKSADLIILCWGKGSTNTVLAEKINQWKKTVFVDGSEVGKDNRWNPEIKKQLEDMTYRGQGAIDEAMLSKCKAYFRREKPYIKSIKPFPFGIERRYMHYKSGVKKDIDIVCIFGQEDYPKMRKEIRQAVEAFGKKYNLVTVTKKTSGFTFDDSTKVAGRDEFYELLARAKIGVSVGGGGYDTARFWEILANNCILLTEKIDIEIPGGMEYDRIIEFKDAVDFKLIIEQIRTNIPVADEKEFTEILNDHSTRARMHYLIDQSQ